MPIAKYPRRRPNYDNQLKKLDQHFSGPHYTAASPKTAGGCRSVATLGPRSFKSAGSDAVSSLPAAITAARSAYPDITFIAGHLLNADFFGPGDNALNLTILTSKANSLHKAFDDKIKQAGDQLNKAYEAMHKAGVDVATAELGIHVKIEVTGKPWGTGYPDKCIFDELKCSAMVKNDRVTKQFVKGLLEPEAGTKRKREDEEDEEEEAFSPPSAKRRRGNDGGAIASGESTLDGADVEPEVVIGVREFKAALQKVKQLVSAANGITVPNKIQ